LRRILPAIFIFCCLFRRTEPLGEAASGGQADYATRVCRAFNDYVSERYRKVDKRLYPMGLLAMQDIKEAKKELRRLVVDLKLPGAMLSSRGRPLHLGHDYYWPIYVVILP